MQTFLENTLEYSLEVGFSHTTLSFDWKSSTYIYQTIGMQVTNYFRSKSIHNIKYIDDRLVIEFVSLG